MYNGTRMSTFTPILFLIIATVSIQLGASFAKQLLPLTGIFGAVNLRLSLAALLLLVLFRPWRVKLNRSDLSKVFYYGGALGAMNLSFYFALERIPLGIAVALEFLGPLTVAILSSRQRIDFLWIVLSLIGVALITGSSTDLSQSIDLPGCGFALLGGTFWALYILFGKKAVATVPPATLVAWGMSVAALMMLPVYLIFGGEEELLNREILPMGIAIAVLSSALPYMIEIFVMAKLPLKRFGILMSLDPAFAALFGFIILSESLTNLQWCAIVCIITASIGSAESQKDPVVTD